MVGVLSGGRLILHVNKLPPNVSVHTGHQSSAVLRASRNRREHLPLSTCAHLRACRHQQGLQRRRDAGVCSSSSAMKDRIQPGPGQESVWDYPRPPACKPTDARVQVYLDGEILADSTGTYRALETSHPPVYYIPPGDVNMQKLTKDPRHKTFCEWKGSATYFNAGSHKNIGWAYESPTSRFAAIKDYIAFYPSKVDKATVNGEEVKAQEGDFYGGWITSSIVGPFKGGAGTFGW